MRKTFAFISIIFSLILIFTSTTASANLRQDAINSNDPNTLVKYLNTTKAGKELNISEAKYTDNNYLVLSFSKKPKIKSNSQRENLAHNFQEIMNDVPNSFVKKGIAFFNGGNDGANLILAFSKSKVSKHNYYDKVKSDTAKDFSAETTAFYIEPSYSDKTDGEIYSGPETQGPKYGPDHETLIEMIQDVTE
ncbi:hypothetical protein [Limosilactobacillus reuteri]|uniref:hypothetical protein n=1 Tax=Limosilactobacillus reuteri TaxID=1598 RepID=UPI0039906B61